MKLAPFQYTTVRCFVFALLARCFGARFVFKTLDRSVSVLPYLLNVYVRFFLMFKLAILTFRAGNVTEKKMLI